MDAFGEMLEVLFSNLDLSTPAIYMPAQHLPVPLRIVFYEPNDLVKGSFSSTRAIAQSLTADILVSDVPVEPGEGSGLEVNGTVYSIVECTQEHNGRIWRVVLADA